MIVAKEHRNMSSKLTIDNLKRIVLEEKAKMKKAGIIPVEKTETVKDAWSGGDNLVNKIDYIKALKIEEAKLRRKADKISKARAAIKSRLVKEL
tara:strand:- start:300 stop:581 length:282 start_codon:yes stop_codon:yes gene_type:complete